MSGFEIAGVILGAIPIVITALERYKAGKGVAASLIKWDGQLDMLIERLEDQRLSFYFDILELLQGARVEDVMCNDYVTEEECVSILRKTKDSPEIKEYFGVMYDRFLRILERYEKCLKAIAAKLTHIYRPPNVNEDDLAAILVANKPAKGAFAFKERVRFTIEKGSLKELVEELREDRLSLKAVIKGMKKQQEYIARQPSREAAKLAEIFLQVQANATPLFAAMCEVCTCDCSTKHTVLMRLDSRVPGQKERLKYSHTAFSLVLSLKGDFHETLVMASQRTNEPEIEMPATQQQPAIVVQPVYENPNGAPRENRPKRVTDICDHAHRAGSSGHILSLQLTNKRLTLLEGPPKSRRVFSDLKTLESFLRDGLRDEGTRMTPKQRTLLALDIAASILQLRQTCWFGLPFNSRCIKLLIPKAGKTEMAVVGPFVEQEMEKNPSGWPDVFVSPDPKPALVELAILLLEIWYSKPLETCTETESLDSEEARMMAAIRWLQTSEDLPLYHSIAIEQCLAVCAGRLRSWNNGEFLREYCENIIKPLRESCKAW